MQGTKTKKFREGTVDHCHLSGRNTVGASAMKWREIITNNTILHYQDFDASKQVKGLIIQ